jgi:hypothetical protein
LFIAVFPDLIGADNKSSHCAGLSASLPTTQLSAKISFVNSMRINLGINNLFPMTIHGERERDGKAELLIDTQIIN